MPHKKANHGGSNRRHRPPRGIILGCRCTRAVGKLDVSARQDGSCQRRVARKWPNSRLKKKEPLRITCLSVCASGHVVDSNKSIHAHLIVPCEVNNTPVADGMIDCGATGLAFINDTFARHLNLERTPLRRTQEVVAADGRAMKPISETVTVQLKIDEHIERITMFVADIGNYSIILGMPWLKIHNPEIDWALQDPDSMLETPWTNELDLAIISNNQAVHLTTNPERHDILGFCTMTIADIDAAIAAQDALEGQDLLNAIPAEYQDFANVFSKKEASRLPKHGAFDHEIKLKEGFVHPYGPLYSLSKKELQETKKFLEEYLEQGLIRPSSSSAGAPILFAKKKDGGLRLCIDFRKLNDGTIKNRYPVPLVRDLMNQLYKARVFTSLDIRGAYHRLRIKEGDEWKAAFRTHFGLYEPLVMWEGLTNAPADFQSFINEILKPHLGDFASAFFDDILIFSENEEEHTGHVRKILRILQKHGIYLRLPKCRFHVQETDYLGFIIGTEGISMDPKKLFKAQEWKEPRSLKETQEFLGFTNFYRRFIRDFSKIAKPLTKVTGNDGFSWGPDQSKAFQDLKAAFSTAPVLLRFNPDKGIILETDASDVAVGGVLSQYDDEGRLHPVDHFSKSHTSAERNYDIYDRELLAIIKAFKYWRSELLSPDSPTDVITDHHNLQTFMTNKTLTPRQVRWANFLSQFNFKIRYRPGKKNGKADYLSRMPGVMPEGGDENLQHRLQRIFSDDNLDPELQEIAKELASITIAVDDIQAPTIQELFDQGYQNDPEPERILQALDRNERRLGSISIGDCTREGNRLKYRGKLYVPKSDPLILRIIQDNHENPAAGHQGRSKTIELIDRLYFWPTMRKDIEKFVRNCHTCRRAKTARHAPFGILRPLPVPSKPWQHISMDFVTGLPASGDEANAIWVVVDRLTKQRHFVPCQDSVDAETLAEMFIDHVWRFHGLPESIVSDRGPQFASDFWGHLCKQLGIERKLSTAFHPQTDGQTERINGIMEQYLRCYVNYAQDDWAQYLPLAEFAGNNAASESTGVSPFFAMHGFDPTMFPNQEPEPPRNMEEDQARNHARILRDIHGHCTAEMRRAQLIQQEQYDRHRLHAPDFRPGDLVWLDARNIRTGRPSRKLDNPRMGPYRIQAKISAHAYRLDLPRRLGIHKVQPVGLLELASNDPLPGQRIPPPPPVEGPEGPEYLVDEILDSRRHGNRQRPEYLVRWIGHLDDDSWESAADFANVDAARNFHQRYPRKPGPQNNWT